MASGKRLLHLHIPVHIMRTVSTVVRSGGLASQVTSCKKILLFSACYYGLSALQSSYRACLVLNHVLTDLGFPLRLHQ
jgi:hypothetical protein